MGDRFAFLSRFTLIPVGCRKESRLAIRASLAARRLIAACSRHSGQNARQARPLVPTPSQAEPLFPGVCLRMSGRPPSAGICSQTLYQATREYIRTGSSAHSSSLVNQESFSVSNPALLWFYTDPIVKKDTSLQQGGEPDSHMSFDTSQYILYRRRAPTAPALQLDMVRTYGQCPTATGFLSRARVSARSNHTTNASAPICLSFRNSE